MPLQTRSAPEAVAPADAPDARLPWSWLVALAALGFALDAALALPVLGEGDAAEFTLALALGGVPHPTGYPLYVLLGHGFVRAVHALGPSWAMAANLWSAAGAGVATLLAAALADRLLPGGLALARGARLGLVAAATIVLAANPVFLRAASQAEVYSWHVAWVAGCALATLTLVRALARRTGPTVMRVRAGVFGWGLLAGAGLAHHLTALFFLVPLGTLLFHAARRARRLDAAVALAALAGVVLPLFSFGLIAWRASHPAAFQWPALETTWGSVLAHVTGAAYRVYVGGFAPSPAEQQLLLVAVLPVVVPGLAIAAVVAARARREAPVEARVLLALVIASGLQVGFTFFYGVLDPTAYFLPVIVVAVAAAAWLGAVLVARREHPRYAAGVTLAAMALVALAWVPPEFEHAQRVAQVDREVRAAFRALPFEHGIVVWQSDSHARLRAYQLLDGDHPGIVVLHPGALTWPAERRARTRELGFDPLAGLQLRSDADLALVAGNIARQTPLPVVDFAEWWARTGATRPEAGR